MSTESVVPHILGSGVLVASWLSFLWLGLAMAMGYNYYTKSRNDPLWLKLLIAVLLGLCITDTIAMAIWTYDWEITHYADPSIMIFIPLSDRILTADVGIVAFIVQPFYAWRLWMISGKKNRWLPTFICIMSTTQMATQIRILVYIANRTFVELSGLIPTIYLWLATSAAADIAVTAGMLWYLRIRIRGSRVRRMTFDQIVSRALQANALSLAVQVATMIMVQFGTGFYWLVTYAALVKVYTISALSSLNARDTNNTMLDPDDSDLSYPLAFPHVKSRTLRLSRGHKPSQLMAVSVNFQSGPDTSQSSHPQDDSPSDSSNRHVHQTRPSDAAGLVNCTVAASDVGHAVAATAMKE